MNYCSIEATLEYSFTGKMNKSSHFVIYKLGTYVINYETNLYPSWIGILE